MQTWHYATHKQLHEQRKYLHIDYPSYLVRKIVYTIHTKKKAYARKYMAQKLINQFFDQVEYPMQQSVCMLCVKTMRYMTAKLQDGYKNNTMHVNPKHK